MSEEEPFFVARSGAVWAGWLSGKPAVRLGAEAEVRAAMEQFIAQSSSGAAPPVLEPASAPPPPPPPPPSPPITIQPKEKRVVQERGEKRHDLTIIGRVRTGVGAWDVTVLDLSERGCRFHARAGQLKQGMPLTVKLGPIGPVEATIRWQEGEYVGVEFNTALYPSVMEHIRQHFDLRR